MGMPVHGSRPVQEIRLLVFDSDYSRLQATPASAARKQSALVQTTPHATDASSWRRARSAAGLLPLGRRSSQVSRPCQAGVLFARHAGGGRSARIVETCRRETLVKVSRQRQPPGAQGCNHSRKLRSRRRPLAACNSAARPTVNQSGQLCHAREHVQGSRVKAPALDLPMMTPLAL